MDKLETLRNLFAGSCDFAVLLLILIAVASIVLFLKVFKTDFGHND